LPGGYFGANYLIVNNAIYGGNLTTGGVIFIGSNTNIGNTSQNVLVITTNPTSSNVALTANNLTFAPSGNITVTGVYYKVNSTNYNVNGAATFANTIAVTGAATLSNTIAVTGAATFSNTISVTNTATFSNNITVAGNTTITSNLVVSSANVTNFLNLSNPSATHIVNGSINILGNMSVTGTLTTTAPATATANLVPASNVTHYLGNTTYWWLGLYTTNLTANTLSLGNNATITGTGTFSNTIGVTGAATFSNTIAVTGATTLSNTIAVTGAATFSNTISVTNTATFSNTIAITGAATFSNTISVTNTATFSNTISVSGVATLSANVAVAGSLISNNISQIYSTSFTFPNSTAAANVDIYNYSNLRAAEYLITVTDNNITPTNYQTTKLLLMHNANNTGGGGTTAYTTEYGTIYTSTSPLGAFSAVLSSGTIGLTFTPNAAIVSTNSVVKFIRTSIAL
jgi:hypothetical protein